MKDIDLKAICPYKAEVKCDAAVNALCDNRCVYHPRYVDDGSNMNYKTHRCPYSESTTCSGEDCGADCCFHPEYDECEENCKQKSKKIDRPDLDFDMNEDNAVSDYEDGLPVRNLTDEEYADLKKKFDAFNDGFEMGVDFALEKESEKKCSLLKDKNNWNGGLAPCVGCERDCPITAGMTELTYDDGYEQAMIDCSGGLEDAYLDGYKDAFYGEPPMIEDDELREVLSEQTPTQKGCRVNNDAEKVVNGDLYVSGKILCMVEDAKERLTEIRREIYTSNINYGEKRLLAFKLIKIVEILDGVQHQYTSDEMYKYLGYIE